MWISIVLFCEQLGFCIFSRWCTYSGFLLWELLWGTFAWQKQLWTPSSGLVCFMYWYPYEELWEVITSLTSSQRISYSELILYKDNVGRSMRTTVITSVWLKEIGVINPNFNEWTVGMHKPYSPPLMNVSLEQPSSVLCSRTYWYVTFVSALFWVEYLTKY